MNAIDKLFSEKKKNILSVYFTAGFPQLNDTVHIIESLQKNGVDLIEIGIPFSDPLADGPVIQESSRVALENGMNIKLLFDQLSILPPAASSLPLILMGYLNPVLQFGIDNFLAQCKACKISGVILPDLPAEVYESDYKAKFEEAGVYFIFLVTPGSPETRVRKLASLSKGFLYLVSSSATTGGGKSFSEEQLNKLEKFAEYKLDIPVLTGFGIHDRETYLAATRHTNGAVIGTAFIKSIAKNFSASTISNFIETIKTPAHDYSA